MHNTVADGADGGFGAVLHFEFREEGLEMRFDGVFRDEAFLLRFRRERSRELIAQATGAGLGGKALFQGALKTDQLTDPTVELGVRRRTVLRGQEAIEPAVRIQFGWGG